MAQVVVELTSNERQLLAAYKTAVKADEELRKSVEATGESGKKAGKKIADGMIAGAKVAADAMKRELSGGLTDGAKKEMQDLARVLRTMGPEGRSAAQAISRHLAIAGREGVESIGDVIAKIDQIDNKAAVSARKARSEFAKLNDAQAKTAGPTGLQTIAKYGAAWISVAGGIQKIAEAMALVRETNERALESLEGNKEGDKRLLQVSQNADDFQKMRNRADELSTKHGIGRDAARNLMFSGRSEGFEESVGFIAQNQQILDVEDQATVAGQIPGLFVNETLSPEQAINMTLAGAEASRLDFGQISRALPGAAEGGAIAGASSTETIATLSVLAGRFKSGETAADRIKALATKIGMDEGGESDSPEAIAKKQETENKRADSATKQYRTLTERRDDIAADLAEEKEKKALTASQDEAKRKRVADLELSLSRAQRGVDEFDTSTMTAKEIKGGKARESLQGMGLVGAVKKLMSMSDDDRKDFLGDSQEVNAAYTIMAEEMGAIEDRTRTIDQARTSTGTDASPVAVKRGAAAADPKLRAILDKQKAENLREIAEENRRALGEADRVTQRDRNLANAENAGVNKLQIAGAQMVERGLTGLGMEGLAKEAIPIIAGGTLNDFSLSMDQVLNRDHDPFYNQIEGDDRKKSQALFLATSQLNKRRKDDPEALLSQTDVAGYLGLATGSPVAAGDVTEQQQIALTKEVSEAASAYEGDQWRGVGGRRDFNVDLANDVLTNLLSAIERQNVLIEQQTKATERTADNTGKGADPALVLQTAAANSE